MIRAFWYESANIGDVLTPFLLAQWTGQQIVNTLDGPKWLVCGSIAHLARPGDTLAGVGSFEATPVECVTRTLFVRGPRTAAQLATSCGVYGDAGLLFPDIYTPARNRRFRCGIVPHYCDADQLGVLPSDATVIPVSLPPFDFIDRLAECDYIAASSLHGIVLAEAYGIPAVRLGFKTSWDRIRSFEFKHGDYYEGTGRTLPGTCTLDEALDKRPEVDIRVAETINKLRRYVSVLQGITA